ncbi:MAG: hypothetical protein IPM37_19230 [Hahellaceae bacterium]|nr:hypothetical protein [Hahellaceae bacterium]
MIINKSDAIFVEDQEEISNVEWDINLANAILTSSGATHSITLIVDSLYLTDLFQRISPDIDRKEIEKLFAAGSNEIADRTSGQVEAASLENNLDDLGRLIFGESWSETAYGPDTGDFANLVYRSDFHENILRVREYLAQNNAQQTLSLVSLVEMGSDTK